MGRVPVPFLAAMAALALGLAPPGARAKPARFTRISIEQGLSQGTVQAILQDHVGFLWFGTEEGLNRYDGYTFVVFKHDPRDKRSLPDNVVTALHEDKQGKLWVGTEGRLSLFDPRTETFTVATPVHGRVSGIVEDAAGTLWVGIDGQGLFERDPATGTFLQHRHDPGDPASLASNVVSALLADRRGQLWIGTRGGGMDRLDSAGTRGRRFLHHRNDPGDPRSLAHDEVWGLAEDATGRVWVATYGGGLSVLDGEGAGFRNYRRREGDPGSLRTNLLTCVLVDRSGTLWVGTDGAGVQQYDATSDRFLAFTHDPADPASLSQNVVRSLYEDGQGQLWVGTYLGGASLLRKPRHAFGYYTHIAADPSSLSYPGVTSFLEDDEGRIWVGMKGGWLDRFDRTTGTFTHYGFPSAAPGGLPIFALHQDARGRIWAGTYRGGLGLFDPVRGTFDEVYRHRPGDPGSLANDEVWALADADDGALWVGTNAGLDRFDPQRKVVVAHYDTLNPEGLASTGVRALRHDRQGNLWVGTFGGLSLLRRGEDRFVRYFHDPKNPRSLSHNGVVSLHEDRQGRLWVGTFGGGLNRLDAATGEFTSYKAFPSSVIFGIQEEPSGRLWLSTNHGLSRFDPATEQVENFDLTNGLQSLQFHVCASLRTRSGRLLFGSADGFYDFDPAAIKPDTRAPPVVLTSLRIFNEPAALPAALPTLKEVTLSHRDKVFSFEFAALDYSFPRRNRYAYAMEGFSDQWIQLGSKRDVTFTNLDPGTYVFRVKASNGDGVWNDAAVAALRVSIRPPFWRTWWFRGLSAAFIALALFSAHRARVHHLTADISERKRAEQALRQAEEKYRSIFENAVEAIFQSTPQGRFLTVNPAFARLLGYSSPEDMVAQVTNIERELYVDPGRRREMLRLLEVLGVVQGFECELRRRDGRTVWVSANIRVVRDESGKALYYEGISEDISDRRRAQELQDSLRRHETMSAMGSLVAGVAHEARNPLFGISANLDAFEARVGTNTEFASTVTLMRGEVNRLTALMQGLLDYGKPVDSAPSPGSVHAVITEALESCASLAASKSVIVVNGGAAGLPPVPMDRKRLVQVFQNILQNAIQYSPVGGSVTLEAREEAGEAGSSIVLTVRDSGPGFASEELPRVFEPFFSRRQGGTGLGLAIVQRIVEEHGGTVSAANRPQGGAEMTVRLPCA